MKPLDPFGREENFISKELWDMLWEAKALAEEAEAAGGSDVMTKQVQHNLLPEVFLLARKVAQLEHDLERTREEADYYRKDGDHWYRQYMKRFISK